MQLYEFKLLIATLMTDAEGHNTLFPAVVRETYAILRERLKGFRLSYALDMHQSLIVT